jgi:subtilisin family serine protease
MHKKLLNTKILLSAILILTIIGSLMPVDKVFASIWPKQLQEQPTEAKAASQPAFEPGVVLVQFSEEVSTRTMAGLSEALGETFTQLGVQEIESVMNLTTGLPARAGAGPSSGQLYRLSLSPQTDVLEAISLLNALPSVTFAEPDYLAYQITMPDDPEYSNQWGMSKINSEAAWDISQGSSETVIAVIDAGIYTSHPDLDEKLWENPGEIPGNGLDDDNNGYVDDIHGWNIIDDNADLSDNTGHGTQVSGVIGAETNNAQGIAGLCWNCKIMVVKVVQSGGTANYSDIAAGVAYAANKGAEVINISLGGNSDSITLKTAVANAAQTSLIVAGAGNDNSDLPFYPAAYDDDVLAVAGTTSSDVKVAGSNYGAWVDVCAPGENIMTTFADGTYAQATGTSLASAFASGLAGLLKSQNPSWSTNLLRAHLIKTAVDISGANPGFEDQLGSGRIDAEAALSTQPVPQIDLLSVKSNGEIDGNPIPGSSVDLTLTIKNSYATMKNAAGAISTSDAYVTLNNTTTAFGTIDAFQQAANANPFTFEIAASAPPAHTIHFSLLLEDSQGQSVTIPFTITTQGTTIDVSGVINTDTIWENEKIYHVTDVLYLEENTRLTIEPGTKIIVDPDKKIMIAGELIADGTESQEIVFTSSQEEPASGDWGPIEFLESSEYAIVDSSLAYVSGSIFRHATIEYGKGITFINHMAYFSNVNFRINSIGISFTVQYEDYPPDIDLDFVIRKSIFFENQIGTFIISRNALNGPLHFYILDNLFQNNTTAIDLSTSSYQLSNITNFIDSNIFLHNERHIFISDGNSKISNNLFLSNSENVFTEGSCIYYDADAGMTANISNNYFSNIINDQPNSSIIYIDNPFHYPATIAHNTFLGITVDKIVESEPGNIIQYNNYADYSVDYIIYRKIDDRLNSNAIDATHNYWGTQNTDIIDDIIFDFYDDWEDGKVLYDPILATPDPDAPAFLTDVIVTPETIGIQSATIKLVFSRAMDTAIAPEITFGTESPYEDFSITNQAQWISDHEFTAEFDINALVPRGTHTIKVANAVSSTGRWMPDDMRFSFVVDYAGTITDQTPPAPPAVLATGDAQDSSKVSASWYAYDAESAIQSYRYAIGTAEGAGDIISWTITNNTSVVRDNLGLIDGNQYYVSVQAMNTGGLWSDTGSFIFTAGQDVIQYFLPVIGN